MNGPPFSYVVLIVGYNNGGSEKSHSSLGRLMSQADSVTSGRNDGSETINFERSRFWTGVRERNEIILDATGNEQLWSEYNK